MPCPSHASWFDYCSNILQGIQTTVGSHDSVRPLCYKPEGLAFEIRWGKCIFSIYLILLAALDPEVYSASNRIKYLKRKNNFCGGVERCRRVRLTSLPPSVNRLSRQCGESYHPTTIYASTACYMDTFTFYKLRNSPFGSFIRYPGTSTFLGSNILVIALFSTFFSKHKKWLRTSRRLYRQISDIPKESI
jgi:hypothetical protein